MKTNFLFLSTLFVFFVQPVLGQLSGVKSIPGDYSTVAAAISALNTVGVGSGGVTFNVAAGHTEVFSSHLSGNVIISGSATNPIVFQKMGEGTNPQITAYEGTGTMDAIITLNGTDYITFDGIDVAENKLLNNTNTKRMEWGFALLKTNGYTNYDGCQHVIIRNCEISLDKTNYRSVAIYAANHRAHETTQLNLNYSVETNSHNKFFNLTISDVYTAFSLKGYPDTAPYTLFDQYNEIGKDGQNSITDFGGYITQTNAILAVNQDRITIAQNNIVGGGNSVSAINVKMGQANWSKIYDNYITLASDGYTYPISDSLPSWFTQGKVDIYDNIITNCNTQSYSYGDFMGILVHGGNKLNIYNNEISNNTHQSGSWYGNNFDGINCYYWADSVNVYANQIFNNTLKGGGIMALIAYECGTAEVHENLIHHDSITDPFEGGFAHSYMYGIVQAQVSTCSISLNQIHDLYCDNQHAEGTGYIAAIFDNGSTNYLKSIHHNTIYNIRSSSNASYSIDVYGMRLNQNNNLHVYNNNVSAIVNESTNGSSNGIWVKAGSNPTYVYNNMISGVYGPNGSGNQQVTGLYLSPDWGYPNVYLFYNSVYLDGTANSGYNGSAALYCHSNIRLQMKNNIFINNASTTGSGVAVAFRMPNTTLSYYSYWSNYNDFYAGTPAANHLIYYDGTNAFQTIGEFKTYIGEGATGWYGLREAQSFTDIPLFLNTTTLPYDLHVDVAYPTLCESGGIAVSKPVNITSDFEAEPRFSNSGYPNNPAYPATNPDVGADEFAGIPADVTPPGIYYNALPNTTSIDSRVLYASISDASGIPVSGAGLPVLYWSINGGLWNAATGVHQVDDLYMFTFGNNCMQGDVISYYIVAQDAGLPVNNVAVYPADGADGFSINPPACATPPSAPDTYRILFTMCSTYNVGTGGNFINLTGPGGFFEAVNNSALTCNLTVNILNDLDETGDFELNQWYEEGAGNYSITIQPNTNSVKVISGTTTGSLIRFNNAQRVLINGGAGKYLLFRNSVDPGSGGAGATLEYSGTCDKFEITNCTIEGNPNWDFTGIIRIMGEMLGDFGIINNNIGNTTGGFLGSPVNCIQGGTFHADSLRIIGNNIYNFKTKGILIEQAPGNSRVAFNSFYYNLPEASTNYQTALYMAGETTPVIHHNWIGGQAPLCGGNPFVHEGFSSFTGIDLNLASRKGEIDPKASAIPNTKVYGNTIQNITIQNDPTYAYEFFTGMRVSGGKAEIGKDGGNLIGSLTTPNSIRINGNGESYGLHVSSYWNTSEIENNTICNLTLTETDGPAVLTGIYTTSADVSRNKIMKLGAEHTGKFPTITGIYDQCAETRSIIYANNLIALDGGAAENPELYGIRSLSSNLSEFYYNSVSVTGAATTSASSYAFYANTPNSVTIQNNILSNTRGAGGTGKHYGMYFGGLTVAFNSDYNDLHTLAEPLAFINGADVANLSNWQTVTAGDIHSVSVNPEFVSTVDLHTFQPALNNSGTYIMGIDYDLDLNPISDPPDMGCYQFSVGPLKTLNLTLFLEGLYAGSGVMNPAVDGNTGLPAWGAGIADKITVQLHQSASPNDPVGTALDVNLSTDGAAQAMVSGGLSGNYYIEVLHRNSVAVWSAVPVSFSAGVIAYNFSDNASSAFGNNLKDVAGTFVLFTGDANHDGVVDGLDLIGIDNQAANSVLGYEAEDLNGDGTVDGLDMVLAEGNAALFIKKIAP